MYACIEQVYLDGKGSYGDIEGKLDRAVDSKGASFSRGNMPFTSIWRRDVG